MIDHPGRIEAPSRASHHWRDWKYVFASLAVLLPSLDFYLRSQADSTDYEIVRAERLAARGESPIGG